MKKIVLILFVLISVSARSNPVVRGTWVGYILQYNPDSSYVKLPCTIYINDDNTSGNFAGEILMTFQYKSGKGYNCKAKISGNIDYDTYEFSMVMEEYVYYDVLPEGMKWCLGSLYGTIGREMELRQYVLLATMRTKCTEGASKVVLIKQL